MNDIIVYKLIESCRFVSGSCNTFYIMQLIVFIQTWFTVFMFFIVDISPGNFFGCVKTVSNSRYSTAIMKNDNNLNS